MASRVTGAVQERLRGLTVFVASEKERDRLARVCGPGQRIVLKVDVEVPSGAQLHRSITPRQAIDVMFGRRHGYR